ncbi:GtrA family protein [Blastococcus sp. TF02A-30]|uniref:GtrA family protein n=1 Tax=Blastococcus sp. TF02A-30 TaxID=2250580 RepID=UPI001F295EEA|nr:GtrA family protein [Blastococcus sp. TF02A-30]
MPVTRCRPADVAGVSGDEALDVAGAEALPQQRGLTQRLVDRLRQDDVWAQFARFVLVGGSTTLVYALLFIPLERYGYLTAHLIATAASTVLANELHRRLTFHADERVGWWTAQWEAGGVTIIGLVATSAALGWLDSTSASAHVALQITCVVAVTALIGLMRFIALRWIFRGPAADEV